MYKVYIFILISVISILAQEIVVTPSGLRDKNDLQKTYVVIKIDSIKQDQLFKFAISYVNKNYKNPDQVIKGKTDNEYVRFITHVPYFLKVNNSGAMIDIDADYSTELNFKDGKVKYEITELNMYAQNGGYKVLFTGGLFEGYPIFNKKNELKRQDTKSDIENYFNNQIKSLKDFIDATVNKKNEDW